MKNAIFAIIAALITLSLADEPRGTEHAFFSVPSASSGQVLVQWPTNFEGTQVLHWKVIDAASGGNLWDGLPKIEELGFLPCSSEVFLAPGGDHLCIISKYPYFRGNIKKSADVTVVWIYNRTSLIKKYTLSEIGVDLSMVTQTASHLKPFPGSRSFLWPNMRIDGDKDKDTTVALFGGTADKVFVTFRDARQVTWSFKTGEIIDTKIIAPNSMLKNLEFYWRNAQ